MVYIRVEFCLLSFWISLRKKLGVVKYGMAKISVAIATFTEEENLRKCLDAIKDWVSEIVVVDGSSTDKTVEIAEKYGAKVIKTTNKPMFHINKQMAIDAATGDWILQLDADEQVTPGLKDEIIKAISLQSSVISGYWIPRKNWFLGRFLMKGGQYPDYTLRLYRRGKGRLPCESVHEQAVVDGKVGYLKNPLLHYPYKSFSDYLFKWGRYTDLVAKDLYEELKSKNAVRKIFAVPDFLLIKPLLWFLKTFLRHKGFMDQWPGFVFSLFSSLRFPAGYVKYLKGVK